MCGIVGVCNLYGEPVSTDLLKRMTDIIAHRGPDGEGHYADGPVGLGHRRLAVIDLSPAGQQPMANETGDVVITYNGEVYNFQELRAELEARGHRFRSRTDTEVVIHAYEEWGEECLDRFNGVFAFAIWDSSNKRLFLARDRFGAKPLYYYADGTVFLFASEIKAILTHPRVTCSVCYPALNEYFTFQNTFSDLTLFEGIRLLPAGCYLVLEPERSLQLTVRRYWDYPFPEKPIDWPEKVTADEVYRLFLQAVTRQLVSDVPIGVYLSGGMDSGSIMAVAAKHLGRLTTFTCGFDLTSASGLELAFDERKKSELLANLFKSEHYEVVLHAGDMEQVMPELIWHLEDLRVGQCYPNYYIARLASKFVKVALCGGGGDELFGGYPWRYYRCLNSNGGDEYLRNYYDLWQRLVPDEDKPKLFNAETWREIAGHSTFDVFRSVFEGWRLPLQSNEDYVNASFYFELKTFLHGLLVVEDRIGMAHSLEVRVPFLDNDLVDFALRLPVRYKVRNLDQALWVDENDPGRRQRLELQTNDGKAILRQAMAHLIPPEITEQMKQGFSAPDASWFRGESIDYINQLLRNSKAMIYEFLQPEYVAEVLDQHCSGQVNRRLLIWSLLSFEWWLRKFLHCNG
jgi:asparagine synthase (glutamine-hydrolysing)